MSAWSYYPYEVREGSQVVALVGSDKERNDLLNDEVAARLERNGRLLAAAPELLAIAELLGEWVDQSAERISLGALMTDDTTLGEAVTAALAKVKGGVR